MRFTHVTTLVLAVMLVAGLGAAAEQTELVSPGVTPDSPFYGLDVAFDNLMMGLGLQKAGAVAEERASEAKAMVKKNKTNAAMKAVNNLNSVAKNAKANSTGLQKAKSVLEGLKDKLPQEAMQGINTALGSIDTAMQRNPTDGESASGGNDTADGSGSTSGTEQSPTN